MSSNDVDKSSRPKEYTFEIVEPFVGSEMLAGYWRYLKVLQPAERMRLGPIDVMTKSRSATRGWLVSLKNHAIAIQSEPVLTQKTAMTFIDLSEVDTVTFQAAHLVTKFLTDGAMTVSPFSAPIETDAAISRVSELCGVMREKWSATIYFQKDPAEYAPDELQHLVEVLDAINDVIDALQEDLQVWADFQECKGLHINNDPDERSLSMVRLPNGELDLSFRFSRALPGNLRSVMLALFTNAA